MYFDDLSECGYVLPEEELAFDYNPAIDTVLNVGWLENGRPFPVGATSSEILERILVLCFNHPVNVTRGAHFCSLCQYDEPPLVEWKGKKMRLGGAEIWVPGKNRVVFAAPNLIYHYVRDHHYCPPPEFREAVPASAGNQ